MRSVPRLFCVFFCIAAPIASAQSWYDTDWSYRKKITIDNTRVSTVDSTNLSNFPILISRTDADWKDTANGGNVAQSDGGDILFTSSNGTTKLDHEIETYDDATGQLIVWVEVPTVSAGSDTDLFIYYGNDAGALAESNPTGVWDSSYAGVWHLGANLEDVLQYDATGIAPSMIHIGDEIYAIAYKGPDDDGWLKTLQVEPGGSISAVLDSLEFDATDGSGPSLIHFGGDIYAVAYKGVDTDGFLKTIDIDATGTIGSVQDTVEFHTADMGQAFAVKVSSTVVAIAFRDVASADGWIKTVDIAAGGAIGSVQDSLEFDTADCKFPWLQHVSGDIYAVSYQGVSADGFLATIDIDSSGNIGAVQDSLEFDTAQNNNSSIAHVSGDIYALAYEGSGADGWLKTIDITTSGTIGSVQDSLEFDTTQGKTPRIVSLGSGNYAIAYRGPDDDGFIKTLPIATDGTISSVIQTVEFDTASGRQVNLVQGRGPRFAMVSKGDLDEGYFRSVQIASNGRIGGIADSTANINNGYTVGMDADDVVTGQVGDGYVANGSSEYGQIDHDASLSLTTSWTLSAWVNNDTLSSYDLLLNKGTSGSNQNYWFGTTGDEISHGFHNGAFREFNTTSENLGTTTWYHIAASFDNAGDQVLLYLDGVEVLDSTTTQSPTANSDALYIGRSQYGEYWDGTFDELRISSTVRSADWIQTSHTNQDTPSSFYSVAAQETPNATPNAPSSLGGAGYVNGGAGIDKTPTLSFTQSDTDTGDTLSYQIQIDDSSDFSSPVVDYTSAALAQGATSFTVGQSAGSGSYTTGSASQQLTRSKYYWRIRSNDGTTNGAWTTANAGAVAYYIGLPSAGVCP